MRLECDSWVMLQLASDGPWGWVAKRHGGENFQGSFKEQIINFSWKPYVHGACNLDKVLVQEAFQPHHLCLDPPVAATSSCMANYLYVSHSKDWVHPTSIIGLIFVLHAEIGEAKPNGRSHAELLEIGTFFLGGFYLPWTNDTPYWKVEALSLLEFNDVEWPLPDMHTSEAFKTRLTFDFANAMKATMVYANQQWFMQSMLWLICFEQSIWGTAKHYNEPWVEREVLHWPRCHQVRCQQVQHCVLLSCGKADIIHQVHVYKV